MSLVYLIEVAAYDPAIPGVITLRYASQGWAGSGAPGFYDGRLTAPPSFQRTAFASGSTAGSIDQGIGELRLANPDGGLDELVNYGLDGRAVTILLGERDDAYASFTTIMRGSVEQAMFGVEEIALRIRDRLYELDELIQVAKYAGTNSGATGQEGLADDIKGQPKPLVFGRVLNITPRLVNGTQLIYQVHSGVADAVAVYEGGLAITRAADYADLAAMTATAPADGEYRACPSLGMFRLGGNPTLPITADVDEGATAADRTAAQILSRIATTRAGISVADVISADVTALDAANASEVGVYVRDDAKAREVMAQIATSIGAFVGFDRLGKLRMARLNVPSGTPVATFRVLDRTASADATTGDIISIERVPTTDEGKGVPAWRVSLRHRRNWTAQKKGAIATSITESRAAFLGEEWRTAVSTGEAVKVKHLRATELKQDSLIVEEPAAATEAARRMELYSVRRDRLRLRTLLTPTMAAVVDLGAIVSVVWPRYGYTGGRLMAVLGMTYGVDPLGRPDLVDLDLWG